LLPKFNLMACQFERFILLALDSAELLCKVAHNEIRYIRYRYLTQQAARWSNQIMGTEAENGISKYIFHCKDELLATY
jgi:hypothetical protein